jgi:hypothetical protein
MTSVHVGRREGPRLLAPVQGKPRRALAGLELATGARGREVGLLAGVFVGAAVDQLHCRHEVDRRDLVRDLGKVDLQQLHSVRGVVAD